MRTIEEINTKIMQLGIMRQGDKIPDVLREWANEIVDCCAENADLKIVNRGWDDYHVVDRDTILQVKKLIK